MTNLIEVTHEVYAVYKNDDGTESFARCKFACIDDDGDFAYLDFDVDTGVDFSSTAGNFVRFSETKPV